MSPAAEPISAATNSAITMAAFCSAKAIADADISSVSLGSTGNGASAAIMAVSSGSTHRLCRSTP
jgi:hypothetical protein